MKMKLINFGAEGSIYETKDNTILKIRESQEFRHPQLDLKLRKKRTKRETNVLNKLYENKINVPKILNVNFEEMSFEMEKIEGEEIINHLEKEVLIKSIIEIAKMHKLNIVHGDLTPLNIIKSRNDNIVIIDFGLSDFSSNIEDKAVDLNVFFSFLNTEISQFENLKRILIEEYSNQFSSEERADNIISRLYEIELRGRNKNKQ